MPTLPIRAGISIIGLVVVVVLWAWHVWPTYVNVLFAVLAVALLVPLIHVVLLWAGRSFEKEDDRSHEADPPDRRTKDHDVN